MKTSFIYILLLSLLFSSCSTTNKKEAEEPVKVTTPVKIANVELGSIQKVINLTAVSSYLKKNMVKSTSTGYITKIFCNIGAYVKAGTPLFKIKTKEAEALSAYGKNNPEFVFNGELTIAAPSTGIITEVTKQANDYVADGEQLCVIAEQSSLVFLLNVPFEQNKHAPIGTKCTIVLPDSTNIPGTITSRLSVIDPVSQTQSFIVKLQTSSILPENLLAQVQLVEQTKDNTQVVAKNCILSDETLENFWVMKLTNDSTAIKVPVKTGIINDLKVEVISPVFDRDVRLVSSGSYGLPDTARVNILQ